MAHSLAKARRKADARKAAAGSRHIQDCEPVCADCGSMGKLASGVQVFPSRTDLHHKKFYVCACGARVGCHPGTERALGRPAGPETRRAREDAHQAFDPIWRAKWAKEKCHKAVARNAGYAWLADQLGYERGKCHIAWMTAEEAMRVVAICEPYAEAIKRRRA